MNAFLVRRQWNEIAVKAQADAPSLSIILHPSDRFPACTCTTHAQWNSISNNFHNSNTRFFIVSNRWRWPSGPVKCGMLQESACTCRMCTCTEVGQSILVLTLLFVYGWPFSWSAWPRWAPATRLHNKMLFMHAQDTHTHTHMLNSGCCSHTIINAQLPSAVFRQ